MAQISQKIQRLTLTAGAEEHITFDVDGYRFLVKNLSDGEDSDVYVSLETNVVKNTSFLIPSGCYQEVFINEKDYTHCCTRDVYLLSDSDAVVEIQVTRW